MMEKQEKKNLCISIPLKKETAFIDKSQINNIFQDLLSFYDWQKAIQDGFDYTLMDELFDTRPKSTEEKYELKKFMIYIGVKNNNNNKMNFIVYFERILYDENSFDYYFPVEKYHYTKKIFDEDIYTHENMKIKDELNEFNGYMTFIKTNEKYTSLCAPYNFAVEYFYNMNLLWKDYDNEFLCSFRKLLGKKYDNYKKTYVKAETIMRHYIKDNISLANSPSS